MLQNTNFPTLTDIDNLIFLVNCQLGEDSLIAGLSRISPDIRPGNYALLNDWHQVVCVIEIPEALNQPESVLLTEEVEYQIIEKYV